jgi:hypothetical protein
MAEMFLQDTSVLRCWGRDTAMRTRTMNFERSFVKHCHSHNVTVNSFPKLFLLQWHAELVARR